MSRALDIVSDVANELLDAGKPDATDFPAVWKEAVKHVAPIKPRGTIRLERSRKAQCWLATFNHVEGMPDGVQVPLPYTLRAGTFIVVSDLQDRFPGCQIFA